MPTTESPTVPPTGGVFRCVVPMRWSDVDSLQHINNVLYFRYLEEARVHLFARAGFSRPLTRTGILAHASCDFLKPLMYPGAAVVSLVLTRLGRTSVSLDVSIECEGEPGVVYARGQNVVVGADPATGRPVPWTPADRAALARCFE